MGGPAFEVRGEVDGEHALVFVAGEFDMDDLPRFEFVLNAARVAGATSLTIDCAGLTFIGSTGLTGLVYAQRRFGDVMLRDVAPNVMRVLDVAGLGGAFTID